MLDTNGPKTPLVVLEIMKVWENFHPHSWCFN